MNWGLHITNIGKDATRMEKCCISVFLVKTQHEQLCAPNVFICLETRQLAGIRLNWLATDAVMQGGHRRNNGADSVLQNASKGTLREEGHLALYSGQETK